jgi:glycosyltransferase involved in cell wall biosynthesis
VVRVSIASLIYKSAVLADWVHDSVHEFTPMIRRGEAEFFFVANDPTEKLLAHLRAKNYPYILQRNKIVSDEQLFKKGYAWPEYIHRVYRGYNQAILSARGEIVVLINSDHCFSPDWLENLLKYSDPQKIVCSQLVEPKHPKYPVFQTAINGEFGRDPGNFKKDSFLDFSMKVRKTGLSLGGAYMPCAFYRDIGVYVGLYPEGNLAGKTYNEIYQTGDEAFFTKLSNVGVRHVTALDSIVYHLKEGEKDDEDQSSEDFGDSPRHNRGEGYTLEGPNQLPSLGIGSYQIPLQPSQEHAGITESLLLHSSILSEDLPLVTVITPTYNRADYLVKTVESLLEQNYPALEYIVLDDGSTDNTLEALKKYENRITLVSHANIGENETVNKGFKMARGEFICVVNSDDPLLPGCLRKLASALITNPQALASYSDWVEIGPMSEPIKEMKLPDYDIFNMLSEFNVSMGPVTMFRRSFLDNYGPRDLKRKYTGDLEFWFRLASSGELIHIPELLATHRTYPDSASVRQKSCIMAEELVSIVKFQFAKEDLSKELMREKDRILAHVYFEVASYCPREPLQRAKYIFLSVVFYLRGRTASFFYIFRDMASFIVHRGAVLLRTLLPERAYIFFRSLWRQTRESLRR